VDGFDAFIIKDPGTRFTALVTGQIHYYGEGSFSLTPAQVAQVERDFSDKIVMSSQLNHWARGGKWSTTKAPWNDVRVRKAVHLALDREDWRAFKQSGTMEGMRYGWLMPPGTEWAASDEELQTWPGLRQPKDDDIAEAVRLMNEVFGDGQRPEAVCTTVYVQVGIDGCLFVADQLKKNLDMEVVLASMEYAPKAEKLISGQFDFEVHSGGGISNYYLDPDDALPTTFVRSYAGAAETTMLNGLWAELPDEMEKLENMVLAQSLELDPVKRKKDVRAIEQLVLNDIQSHLIIAWQNVFPAWRSELRGWKGYDYYSYTKWHQWERVWLAN
jgi:ABC-type transport system substrate-binding protein